MAVKRLALGVGIVATIVVGAWASIVTAWMRAVDPRHHHLE